MINATLKDGAVKVEFKAPKGSNAFPRIVQTLKNSHCTFDPETKEWSCPYAHWESLFDKLSDIDVVQAPFQLEDVETTLAGKPGLEYEKTRRIPDYSLMKYPPIHGKAPYENFQAQGIALGINQSRYLYAWDCGTGKSYVAAALIAHRLLKYGDCGKVLLVTSSIGVKNLYHELFKFIKGLDELSVEMADKDNRNPFDHKEKDIVVTSYNSFRLICDHYKKQKGITSKMPRKPFLPIEEWADGKPVMLILDEFHAIDNRTSQQSAYMLLHKDCFKYRYFFSATPYDKIEKQWAPLTCLDPWLTWRMSYTDWLDKMANIGTYFSKYGIRNWKQDEVAKQTKRVTDGYGSFYKTTDVVDLPNYMEKRIYIPMSPEHRRVYQDFVSQQLPTQGNTRDLINSFPYLSLSLDDPSLLEKHMDKFSEDLRNRIKSFKYSYLEKFKALDDIVADHSDDKILVWATHPKTITEIANRYVKLDPIVITGDTKQEERNALLDEFKNGKSRMLVGNISCLNTSVTLTECCVQVYFSRAFNYTEVAQSQCRIFRIGQTRDVKTYILIYDRSLDCLIDKNLSNKGKLVSGLASKSFISQKDWVKIFNCSEDDVFGEA